MSRWYNGLVHLSTSLVVFWDEPAILPARLRFRGHLELCSQFPPNPLYRYWNLDKRENMLTFRPLSRKMVVPLNHTKVPFFGKSVCSQSRKCTVSISPILSLFKFILDLNRARNRLAAVSDYRNALLWYEGVWTALRGKMGNFDAEKFTSWSVFLGKKSIGDSFRV